MTTQAHLATTIPPTADEWASMADYHLRALLVAYVVVNGSASSTARLPAKDMGKVVTELGRAADFTDLSLSFARRRSAGLSMRRLARPSERRRTAFVG